MPRYFFNIFDGHSHQDKNGEEMQDDQTAWRGATELARSIQEAVCTENLIQIFRVTESAKLAR